MRREKVGHDRLSQPRFFVEEPQIADQHHAEAVESFSRTYKTDRLVYYEVAESAEAAFAPERQIKNWRREKKVALIEAMNPYWEDLSEKTG